MKNCKSSFDVVLLDGFDIRVRDAFCINQPIHLSCDRRQLIIRTAHVDESLPKGLRSPASIRALHRGQKAIPGGFERRIRGTRCGSCVFPLKLAAKAPQDAGVKSRQASARLHGRASSRLRWPTPPSSTPSVSSGVLGLTSSTEPLVQTPS